MAVVAKESVKMRSGADEKTYCPPRNIHHNVLYREPARRLRGEVGWTRSNRKQKAANGHILTNLLMCVCVHCSQNVFLFYRSQAYNTTYILIS